MKTSDISDKAILEYLAARQGTWTSLWYGHFKTSKDPGFRETPDVYDAMPVGTPSKIALSKMRQLHKRGLVGGCPCGCRGDFEITDKGLSLIGRQRVKAYTGY